MVAQEGSHCELLGCRSRTSATTAFSTEKKLTSSTKETLDFGDYVAWKKTCEAESQVRTIDDADEEGFR